MHRRGVCELRDLGKLEQRSADREDFAAVMSELHEKIKQKLLDNSHKYKQRADIKRREKESQVGDLMMVYLRK